MRVVVALGGNALLKRGEPMTAEVQRSNVKTAAQVIGPGCRKAPTGPVTWQWTPGWSTGPARAAYEEVDTYPTGRFGCPD